MGQNYKEVAEIALKRRQDAIPKEYLLAESLLQDVPRDLSSIPPSSQHFTTSELDIIESSAAALLQRLHSRDLTSVEVTKAFCKASAVAQQLVRAILYHLDDTLMIRVDKLSYRNSILRSTSKSKVP